MKSMTCSELGGACDQVFAASSFQEIAQKSQHHGKEMMQKGDGPHLEAMKEMLEIAKDPNAMKAWMAEKEQAFLAKPED